MPTANRRRRVPPPRVHSLWWTVSAAATALFLTHSSSQADVRLPGVFSDHMVLQQGAEVPVWGWAGEGEQITVRFRKQTVSTVGQEGKWRVTLKKLKAGGPDTLTIDGNNKVAFTNVLVGEVWVCSGQSNMEWPLKASFQPDADIAASANPKIRLFTVPKARTDRPVTNVISRWQVCGPESVPGFSAVGYYFGRSLQQARQVPVGLIHTSWGGSPAEAWLSEAALATNAGYQRDILDAYPAALKSYQEALAKFDRDQAELKKAGKTSDARAPWPPWRPAELYNGMLYPLMPFAIKGAIWYQGESNAGRAWQYRSLFADMIRNWRKDWGLRHATFLAVQLAPWDKGRNRTLEAIGAAPGDSDWAELREAQMIVAKTLPNVGVAVITDVGDKDDIHPPRKAPVGERLAFAARTLAYDDDKVLGSGPVYRSMTLKGNQVALSFDHVGKGLEARGGELTGFAIAGSDQKWVWAKAAIQGDQVLVSSPEVPSPVAVRYGWSDFPIVNLWNKNGLPASPFRTDDFPMLTRPK